ncbi:MAG: KH domain-containing protein [Anaerolineae bacterium]
MKELIEYIAKGLVDHPDQVRVTEQVSGRSVVVRLKVAQADMGRVIGKDGRVANAMRTLLRVTSARDVDLRIG